MKTITLKIVSAGSLPDGGPLSYQSRGGRFEIGRDSHRDWNLPDPQFFISGRHCEIAFDGEGYVLTDLSRNGTFVNGSQNRVKSPYRLQNGDKLVIGHYTIAVSIQDVSDGSAHYGSPAPGPSVFQSTPPAFPDDDIWNTGSSGPAPADRNMFLPKAQQPGPAQPDFVHSHLDIPQARPAGSPFGGPPAADVSMQNSFAAQSPFGHVDRPQPVAPMPSPVQPLGIDPNFLSAFKLGARLPDRSLHNRNPSEVAQELGALMLLIVEQVMQLLKARASAKAMIRTSDRTIIGALDNNPMKFMADASEALDAMLSKDRSGYLDGMRAFGEAFGDIKTHELATYAAMQKALKRLFDDLSPDAINAKIEKSTFSNNKAKAWDLYVQRWDAKTEAYENGILDVFLNYFADAYQEAVGKKRR